MVLATRVLSAAAKETAELTRNVRKRTFIDSVRIYVKGGAGGMGLPRYGGIGGKGGDIYVVANKTIPSLKNLIQKNPTKRFSAGVGQNSRVKYILGEPGTDCHIEVPVGVSVITDYGRLLGDLDKHESSVLVAQGGAGGSPQNQYSGQKGQAHSVVLDLKLIADVGLVGFPNAGKSTLLTAISKAKPKIASYPFTTIQPSIGIIKYKDLRMISLADLPGLIEGAHYNIGMGHKFLKHVERTKLLLFVIDINGFQLSYKYPFRSAFETVILLNKELELYKEELLQKPAILLINKMDTDGSREKLALLMEQLKDIRNSVKTLPAEIQPRNVMRFDAVLPIAAKYYENIVDVREKTRQVLDINADLEKGLMVQV